MARRAAHLYICGCSTDQRRNAGCLMRILGEGCHERQVDVNMRIYESGERRTSRLRQLFRPRRESQVRHQLSDGLTFDVRYLP